MTKAMSYELTEPKVGNAKAIKSKVTDNVLDKVSTSRIVWHLVKRHKFGIVATWAVLITALWIFPPLPDVLTGLFKG